MDRVLANIFVVAGIGALASGCLDPALPPGATRPYADGYRDGCDSGYSDAHRDGYALFYYRDQPRYEADGEYRTGWDEGYAVCYEEQIRTPYMMPGGSNVP